MIAVLFEAQVTPAQQERYLALAAQLKPLLETIDGFIAIERFQSLSAPGKILSLSWWRDEQAVTAWKRITVIRRRSGKGGSLSLLIIRFAWHRYCVNTRCRVHVLRNQY